MDSKFIIPIVAMLAGLGTWTVYFIAHGVSDAVKNWSPQVDMGLALVAGGLIAISGYA